MQRTRKNAPAARLAFIILCLLAGLFALRAWFQSPRTSTDPQTSGDSTRTPPKSGGPQGGAPVATRQAPFGSERQLPPVHATHILQRIPSMHRLILHFGTLREGWVDTALSPESLAGRPVAVWWRQRYFLDPEQLGSGAPESLTPDVEVRFVPDSNRSGSPRPSLDIQTKPGLVRVRPGSPLRLSRTTWMPLQFPKTPGRIEARLVGGSRGVEGYARIVFETPALGAGDVHNVVTGGMDLVFLFLMDLEELPELPPWPPDPDNKNGPPVPFRVPSPDDGSSTSSRP